jgi:hypothetical protein
MTVRLVASVAAVYCYERRLYFNFTTGPNIPACTMKGVARSPLA